MVHVLTFPPLFSDLANPTHNGDEFLNSRCSEHIVQVDTGLDRPSRSSEGAN